jgi:hypothetical protein
MARCGSKRKRTMSIVNAIPLEINGERPSRKAALLGDPNRRPKALPVNEVGIPQELKKVLPNGAS